MQQEIHFTQKEYGNGITAITAPMQEQIYLVQGSKKALLIDNGMGIGSLKTYVESFCNLPLLMLNTHGHPDHAAGMQNLTGRGCTRRIMRFTGRCAQYNFAQETLTLFLVRTV